LCNSLYTRYLPIRWAAALVACLLLSQTELNLHEENFKAHLDGDSCLTCLAGANLHHGGIMLDVPVPIPPIPMIFAVARAWTYLPFIVTSFLSRGPPNPRAD
jgi:hypothetical protein